jgi:hypothetical protein
MGGSVIYLLRLSMGVLFALAVAGKLKNPGAFIRAVRDYKVLPAGLSSVVGVVLIPTELALAFSHLTGKLLLLIAPLGIFVLSSFAAAIALNLARGREINCGCFGGGSD